MCPLPRDQRVTCHRASLAHAFPPHVSASFEPESGVAGIRSDMQVVQTPFSCAVCCHWRRPEDRGPRKRRRPPLKSRALNVDRRFVARVLGLCTPVGCPHLAQGFRGLARWMMGRGRLRRLLPKSDPPDRLAPQAELSQENATALQASAAAVFESSKGHGFFACVLLVGEGCVCLLVAGLMRCQKLQPSAAGAHTYES